MNLANGKILRFFRQNNKFFEFFEKVYVTFSPKVIFFEKKAPAGMLTHKNWVVDTKMDQHLDHFFEKLTKKQKLSE